MSIYNIDGSRLTKFEVKPIEYIKDGEGLKIINNFQNEVYVIGNMIDRYSLEIYNEEKLVQISELLNGQGIKIPKFNYRLILKKRDKILQDISFNPKNKDILLHLDSHCLGDTIAWVPYVEDYYNKHQPSKLYVTNFWNQLFENPNLNIEIVDHYDHNIEGLYSAQTLGYEKGTEHQTKNLQNVMCDLMGINYLEKRPLMKKPKLNNEDYARITHYGKYVCITEHATDISKTWLHKGGWQKVVDYLCELGYNVVVISKEPTKLKNVIDQTNQSIERVVKNLLYSQFFIGLPSGLSWLAWALKKKVVMIGGFSLPYTEFQENQYRVINNDVCTGCWNVANLNSGKENNYCPRHFNTNREHECSKQITFEMVKDKIDEIINY